MRTTAELAAALRENFDGHPWHGSALRTLVAAVAPERAHLRPSDDVRSAAELLAHAIPVTGIPPNSCSTDCYTTTAITARRSPSSIAW